MFTLPNGALYRVSIYIKETANTHVSACVTYTDMSPDGLARNNAVPSVCASGDSANPSVVAAFAAVGGKPVGYYFESPKNEYYSLDIIVELLQPQAPSISGP